MDDQSKKNAPSKMTYKEYMTAKDLATKKKGSKMPLPLKIFLLTPLFIVFLFGLIFIPYIIYQIATGKPAPEVSEKDSRPVSAKSK